jgi:nucleobase transporter 1/2
MIILSVVGKFGAVFVTIPNPVIGAVLTMMFGMITAVGLSALQVGRPK